MPNVSSKQKEFTKSLEYIYSHPWRALFLKTLLPSIIFNRVVMDRDIYTIFSTYSELGQHTKLKNVLETYSAQLTDKDCEELKAIARNPKLSLQEYQDLNRIAKEAVLKLKDRKRLSEIAGKFNIGAVEYKRLTEIIEASKLTEAEQEQLKNLLKNYTTLSEEECQQLNEVANKKSSASKEQCKQLLEAIANNASLSDDARNQFNRLARKSKFADEDCAYLRTIAAKPRLDQVVYQALSEIATKTDYDLAVREKLLEIANNQRLSEPDRKALLALAERSNYSNEDRKRLIAISVNPQLSIAEHQQFMRISENKKLTAADFNLLKTFAKKLNLGFAASWQLKAIIKSAPKFKLSAEFLPQEFFKDVVLRHFFETLQPEYQGAAKTKQLTAEECQTLTGIAQEIENIKKEGAELLRKIAANKELSTKDRERLEIAIIGNSKLPADSYRTLKALAGRSKVAAIDGYKIRKCIENHPCLAPEIKQQLDTTLAKFNLKQSEHATIDAIVEKLASNNPAYKQLKQITSNLPTDYSALKEIAQNKRSKLSKAERKRLLEITLKAIPLSTDEQVLLQAAAEDDSVSVETRDNLKAIIENKQLDAKAREHLKKIKVVLNRLADKYEFDTRIAWQEEARCFTKFKVNQENQTESLQASQEQKLDKQANNLSEVAGTSTHRSKKTAATKIKQRQRKELVNTVSKFFTRIFAVCSGGLAFVATFAAATAFTLNPLIALVLAGLVGTGTTLTCSQLNKNHLGTFLTNLFIKRNLFRHLSGKQKFLLLLLGACCLLTGVGASVIIFSLLTAKLALVLTAIGIACPPFLPIIIGIGIAPLIGLITFVTYFNGIHELIKHHSFTKFRKFLYKNFIQDFVDASNFSERLAQLGKCALLITFGLGGLALAGATATVAALVLNEAAHPLMHKIIEAIVTHLPDKLSYIVEGILIAATLPTAIARFLTSSEHFTTVAKNLAEFGKQVVNKLFSPLQSLVNHLRGVSENIFLSRPMAAQDKKSFMERFKNVFIFKVANDAKQLKSNPWKLTGAVEVTKNIASSTLLVLNGAGEAALPAAVETASEFLERSEEIETAVVTLGSSLSIFKRLLDSVPAKTAKQVWHQRQNYTDLDKVIASGERAGVVTNSSAHANELKSEPASAPVKSKEPIKPYQRLNNIDLDKVAAEIKSEVAAHSTPPQQVPAINPGLAATNHQQQATPTTAKKRSNPLRGIKLVLLHSKQKAASASENASTMNPGENDKLSMNIT